MTSRLYLRDGVHPTLVDASGNITWTTSGDRRGLQSLDTAIINLSTSISWPDLIKRNAYAYDTKFPLDVCDSFITWIGQEWGPGRANDLPATLLGYVPGGTDKLSILAKMTRTVAPSQVLGWDILVNFKQGEWRVIQGEACIVEKTGYFSRGFTIEMGPYVDMATARPVYLKRFQTVATTTVVPWRGDNDGSVASKDGWTHGGGSGSANGIPVYHRDSKNAAAALGKYRAGSNACSVTDPTNYGTTYSADLIILPVRRS